MKRTQKQVVYGLFYACVWAGIFFGFWAVFVKPAPSCTDNLKNRDEVETDCGGQFCVGCEIKRLPPLQILPVQILSGIDSAHSMAVVELRNPNSTYGTPKLTYDLTIFKSNPKQIAYSERVDLPMYPSEVKYRIAVNVPIPFSEITGGSAVQSGEAIAWRTADVFAKPQLPIREIKTIVTADRIVVNGLVKNDNPYQMRRVTVNVLFEDAAGKIQTASKTVVNDVIAFEERSFQVVLPLPAGFSAGSSSLPRVVVDGER